MYNVPTDKAFHFIAGQVIALGSVWMGLPWSIVIVVLIAAGKEVWDKHNPPHQCDVWDAVVTVVGAVPIWIAYCLK